MSLPPAPPQPVPADTPQPRRQRGWPPMLALLGLGSLPTGTPALPLELPSTLARVHELRARLQAVDLASLPVGLGDRPAQADPQVAQWQKWNDWDNWAKWGKQ